MTEEVVLDAGCIRQVSAPPAEDLYDRFEAAALRLKSARRGIDDARIELEIALERWLEARAALSGALAPAIPAPEGAAVCLPEGAA